MENILILVDQTKNTQLEGCFFTRTRVRTLACVDIDEIYIPLKDGLFRLIGV